jgi:CheY-like chemotaxis protein
MAGEKILVVDDDDDILLIVQTILGGAGLPHTPPATGARHRDGAQSGRT